MAHYFFLGSVPLGLRLLTGSSGVSAALLLESGNAWGFLLWVTWKAFEEDHGPKCAEMALTLAIGIGPAQIDCLGRSARPCEDPLMTLPFAAIDLQWWARKILSSSSVIGLLGVLSLPA